MALVLKIKTKISTSIFDLPVSDDSVIISDYYKLLNNMV